jgi:hypothetical protein
MNMSTKTIQGSEGTSPRVAPVGDYDSLVEKVWLELQGNLSREQIGRMVAEIARQYEDAPVQTFVPILVHRQVVDALKRNPDKQ